MGGKRVVRRKISTNDDYMDKLNKLARACNYTPAEFAMKIICAALDSPPFVHSIQKKYTREGRLWVSIQRGENGKADYKIETGYEFVRQVRSIRKDRYLNFQRDKRLSISLSNEYDKKMGLLVTSLACKKAELAALILHFSLDSDQIVMQLQDIYCVQNHLRVTPLVVNGEVSYVYLSA
ncbi:hypothetical protein AM501_12615 [Aneurinibacillus migulanus]|nr:hypothetical protein TS64_09485 [Aneurinibacillus migulanus]KPD07949.1 hypothetical protein AM501_12615 [Aneurinibacillus migulanus]